ncbi:GTPase (G3E family) [Oribacterium sp. C9]|uniref:GTP-binding protein n=1 Tax=Oribacterium sp. C9 TaxID=1943579 RepID=UPI000990299C|nr:GTP-binding protein [Oribacterium sp. C9]OON85801.1 GTPase (G3E family) [Oribacterium sp. C9]
MIKIDLITGFLGSGKTSFIKKYAKYLIDQGERICILENDYGAINIDMVMLNDLLGSNCELEMVVGGDGHEAHQRRFRTKLISMGMLGYTRVIIEPSGIYDIDEFFDTLCESPLDRWYEIGSVISIVDGSREELLSPEAEYLLMSESACAGKLIISKLQSEDTVSVSGRIVNHLNETLEKYNCRRRFSVEKDIIAKDWETFTDQDFESIKNAGFMHASHVKLPLSDNSDFQSLFYFGFRTDEADIRDRISKLLQDTDAGNIIRIKGFMALSDSGFLEINATKESINLSSMANHTEDVLIIIGEKLDKNRIAGFFPGAVTV